MLRGLLCVAALAAARGEALRVERWPDEPVADADGSLFRKLQLSLGADKASVVAPTPLSAHGRALAGSDAGGPPSYDDIATFNIVVFLSIALVAISYFSIMSMVNMDYQSDSLLYSKAKTD